MTTLLGAATAGGIVVAALYHQATLDVAERLAGPVWTPSSRVMSAPMELWPGLAITPGEVAADLQRAGYARVARASAAGDFEISGNDLLIKVPAASGPGWKVAAGDVHIAFGARGITAISPRKRVTLAPVELAELRGSDNEARRPVSLEQLPSHVPQAVLAMEDARFYEHPGIDPLGIARALARNLVREGPLQGGSTLTQQLVKNLLLTHERTWERKAREALLAVALEQELDKDAILELYLNEIYLGQGGGASVCGVDQAARVYFGKPASRLTIAEAATLAGIVSAPNRYSPLQHPERAKERRDLALRRMAELGHITPSQLELAVGSPLGVHPSVGRRRAPWMVDAAVDAIEAQLGEGILSSQEVTVYTTLQPALQRLAETVVAESAAELDRTHARAKGAQIALVAVRVSDGAVVAMVGGRDYGSSQFNRVLHAHRQVGSTIKPLTALAAFERDPSLSPASLIDDAPIERTISGKRWSPQNYDGRYLGEMPLREAIARSRNTPAVLLAEEVGMDRLAVWWRRLGLVEASELPAASLGAFPATPLELAAAYTIFPGQGQRARPHLIQGATDDEGAVLTGKVPRPVRQADPASAFLATRLLTAVMTEGTGRKASSYGAKGAVGGKSGTTDEARDAWFVGFTPELAVAVWVGFDKSKPVGLTGSQAALPAWSRFVAGSGTTGGRFRAPSGVETLAFCVDDWQPADGAPCETVSEYVRSGTRPSAVPIGQDEEELSPLGRAWDRLWGREDDDDRPEPTASELERDNNPRRRRRRLFGRRRVD